MYLYPICLLCLGCHDTQKPVEVDVEVDVVHPVAQLLRSIPPSGAEVSVEEKITETSWTGKRRETWTEPITLEFTEVPLNLKIDVEISQHSKTKTSFNNHIMFSIESFEYNGNKTATFAISGSNYQIGEPVYVYTVLVSVVWSHGYQEHLFDIPIKQGIW